MSRPAATCPNCGARVEFRWSSAVQTVCPFCRSILVRQDVDLKKVGTVADLPPSSSPIQLGSAGRYRQKPFEVVGRIIYEWAQGGWNEWHVVFSDSSSGWLSDAQAEYAVSFLAADTLPRPPEAQAQPGRRFTWLAKSYEVTAVTSAHYRGVEGDLPFEYWDKAEVRFVDLLTADGAFATLDYSEETPLLFLGEFVEFRALALTNLRQFDGW
jgi:uncharacterized protein DUF4178